MVNLGIDIGGGTIKIARLNPRNAIIGGRRNISIIDTDKEDPTKVIERVNGVIQTFLTRGRTIESAGIAMTGLNRQGIITHSTKLPHWKGVDLNTMGKNILDVGVHVCNDALGAAHSLIPLVQERAHNVLYLTLGSGLGGTLLRSDGTIEPLEPGQSPDPMGRNGTIEKHTGKESLKVQLIELLQDWHGITLIEQEKLTFKDIEDIVLKGEINFAYTENLGRTKDQQEAGIRDKCIWVRNDLVRRLCILAGTLSGAHQVYTVVLGGGPASGHPDFLINPLKKAIAQWVAGCETGHPFYSHTPLDVMKSPHGKNSGVVGAAIYGRMMEEKKTAA